MQAQLTSGAASWTNNPEAAQRALLEHAMWLVWVEGGDTVGPVSAKQIARGIRAGQVPPDASVQRAGEVFWTGVLDEPVVIAALKSE